MRINRFVKILEDALPRGMSFSEVRDEYVKRHPEDFVRIDQVSISLGGAARSGRWPVRRTGNGEYAYSDAAVRAVQPETRPRVLNPRPTLRRVGERPTPMPSAAAAGAVVMTPADVKAAVLAEAEKVHHPAHYGGADDPYEAIKVIEAWGLDFNLGNVVKYVARAGKKDDARVDLEKARWYLDRAITRREQT